LKKLKQTCKHPGNIKKLKQRCIEKNFIDEMLLKAAPMMFKKKAISE